MAPIVSAPVAVDERVNLACSGAREANLWPAAAGGQPHFGEPPQVDRLAALARRDDVRMVVLTVGANDVGFGELVAGCALDWARSSEEDPVLCRARQAKIDAALPAMERGLRKALRGVREALAAAGYRRSDYRLVTVGYASPFPAGRWSAIPRTAGAGSTKAAARSGTPTPTGRRGRRLDRRRDAGRRDRAGAEFLDLRHALDGHQLCDRRSRRVGPEGPSPQSAEWVRRLAFVQGSSRESLHPNAYGQRAIGACIGLLYAGPRGDYACHAEPGRGYVDGMRLELLAIHGLIPGYEMETLCCRFLAANTPAEDPMRPPASFQDYPPSSTDAPPQSGRGATGGRAEFGPGLICPPPDAAGSPSWSPELDLSYPLAAGPD